MVDALPILVPFRRSFPNIDFLCILVAPWLTFGSLLAPFGSLWLPFDSLWLHFGSLWLHFGSLWLPFGILRGHFLTFGSILASLLHFSCFLAPFSALFSLFFVSFLHHFFMHEICIDFHGFCDGFCIDFTLFFIEIAFHSWTSRTSIFYDSSTFCTYFHVFTLLAFSCFSGLFQIHFLHGFCIDF